MSLEKPDRDWEPTIEEEDYFRKLDAELIDRLRRRAALEEERRLLAKVSGINDQEILLDLEKLGYNRDTIILLHLVPLVHVAWMSGSVTERERERILAIARLRGVKEGTPAHRQLEGWLGQRPPEAFFQRSLRAIRMVLQALPARERKARKNDLIQYCTAIASASSGLFGLGPRICAAERKLLRQIAAELERDHEMGARQVMEESQTVPAPNHVSLRFFRKILLVVDEERPPAAALERAVLLAKQNRALLTLAGTCRAATPAMEQRLENLAAAAGKEGVAVERRLLCGTPHLEVIREVLRNSHDLVMVVAEGKGGLTEALFGATTMKLLRKCPCPVWVMKGTQQGRYARIMAAVDLKPSGEESGDLNDKIMDLAVSMARMEGSELHVIHAWTFYAESALREEPVLPEGTTERAAEDEEKTRQQWLAELLQRHPLEGLTHQVHLLQGEAGALIPEAAKAHAIDLIILGTVGRAGIPGLLIGNTAEKILQHVDCAVLAVKPDGFATPVRLEAA
jgi:universal stress protein E